MMTAKNLARYAFCLVSLAIAGTAVAGCYDAEYPQLCLFKASSLEFAPQLLEPESCPKNFQVEDGEAFFILSVLPDDVIAPAPLHVTLKTPCETVELEQEYTLQDEKVAGGSTQRSRALIPVVAPRGASCSLVVTAAVANYRGQESSHGTGETCDAIGAQCAAAISEDAGVDGGP